MNTYLHKTLDSVIFSISMLKQTRAFKHKCKFKLTIE